mgnify:CR=1 FL=1
MNILLLILVLLSPIGTRNGDKRILPVTSIEHASYLASDYNRNAKEPERWVSVIVEVDFSSGRLIER